MTYSKKIIKTIIECAKCDFCQIKIIGIDKYDNLGQRLFWEGWTWHMGNSEKTIHACQQCKWLPGYKSDFLKDVSWYSNNRFDSEILFAFEIQDESIRTGILILQ